MVARVISSCLLFGLASCGPSIESGDASSSSDGTGDGSTAADSSGVTGQSQSSTTTTTGNETSEDASSSSGTTGDVEPFSCGDVSCAPGAEACLLCEPPTATMCIDPTRNPADVLSELCGRPQRPDAVIVACQSSDECPQGSSCMWTLSFGYTIVECAPLACAAQCSCTPQLRQLCNTLADCPECAVACDDSLELGLSLKTCK